MKNKTLHAAVVMVVALNAAFQAQLGAAQIQDVTVVNVSPSAFELVWSTAEVGEPVVEVFADPDGAESLVGELRAEANPLRSGDPQAANEYQQRQTKHFLAVRTRAAGLSYVRVSRCKPDTTYYFRVRTRHDDDRESVFPESGPLPSVRTAVENSFATAGRTLILSFPGGGMSGRIVTVTHEEAAYGVAAVVADGAGPNEAYLNLSDLFDLETGRNFTPLGEHEFDVTVRGGLNGDSEVAYTLAFTADFAVTVANLRTAGSEFFALRGQTVAQPMDQSGSMDLNMESAAPVREVIYRLSLPAGRLENLALADLPPAVESGEVLAVAGEEAVDLRFVAREGETFQGSQRLGRLQFTPVTGVPSYMVRLRPLSLQATKADGAAVLNVLAEGGKVVVLGKEPLLDARQEAARGRFVVLYGLPGNSYRLEANSVVGDGNSWSGAGEVLLSEFSHEFDVAPSNNHVFYRVRQLLGDQPLLQIARAPDGRVAMTVVGKADNQLYQLEEGDGISDSIEWRPVIEFRMTEQSHSVEPMEALDAVKIFRVRSAQE